MKLYEIKVFDQYDWGNGAVVMPIQLGTTGIFGSIVRETCYNDDAELIAEWPNPYVDIFLSNTASLAFTQPMDVSFTLLRQDTMPGGSSPLPR